METNLKIVDFDRYCNTCKFASLNENEEPCNECLTIAARENSRKPEKYQEDKK